MVVSGAVFKFKAFFFFFNKMIVNWDSELCHKFLINLGAIKERGRGKKETFFLHLLLQVFAIKEEREIL